MDFVTSFTRLLFQWTERYMNVMPNCHHFGQMFVHLLVRWLMRIWKGKTD